MVSLAFLVLPRWEVFLVAVVFATALAVALRIVVRLRRAGVEPPEPNHEAVGFIAGATVGVCAFLLAFVVFSVREEFAEGRPSVEKESGAAATLFHYAARAEFLAAKLHERLVVDLEATIGSWAAIAVDRESFEMRQELDGVYRAAQALNRAATRAVADMSEALIRIDNLSQARGTDLGIANGFVPAAIAWFGLLAAAGLAVSITLSFGGPSRLLEIAVTTVLTILLTSSAVSAISLAHQAFERVLVGAENGGGR